MAKKLSKNALLEIRRLLMLGEAPSSIAEVFNVGVSTIYNYRNQFRAAGDQFPVIQGKRPRDLSRVVKPEFRKATIPVSEIEDVAELDGLDYTKIIETRRDKQTKKLYFMLELNDTLIKIDAAVKTLTIKDGKLVMEF